MSPSPKKPVARKGANARKAGGGGLPFAPGPVLRHGMAYFMLVFALVALLATVSHSYGGSKDNWMGPYLGDALAQDLGIVCGKLPTLFLIVALSLTGLWLLIGEGFGKLLRASLGFWSLFLTTAVLLTLRITDLIALSRDHLEQNGGLLGLFLVRHAVQPIFGAARVGPVLVCALVVVITFVVAFGLRPFHLKPAFDALVALLKGLGTHARKIELPSVPALHLPSHSAPLDRNEDTSDFEVIRKGKVKPFDANPPAPAAMAPQPAQAPRPVPVATPQPEPVKVAAPMPTDIDPDALDSVEAIEAYLRANGPRLAPMEKRLLRDKMADLRRVSEINQWEDRKDGQVKIEGMVKVDAPSPDLDRTVVAKKSVAADPVAPSSPDVAELASASQPAPLPAAPQLADSVTKPVELDAESVAVHKPEPERKDPPAWKPMQDIDPFSAPVGEYHIPKVGDVLAAVPAQVDDYTEEELKQKSKMLEQVLENFHVKGKVENIVAGPVITRFEVEPGPGVKVSRFAGLNDDLALSLKANSIRVLAPIPGKSVVGIEIPNRKAQTIHCREILESPRFMPSPDTLQIVLGKDIVGNAFTMDLARAPHLLIAGQTGAGKSVCINTLMASLLFSKSPDDLRMILVDPKVVELKSYEKIPHLLHSVVTDPGVAVQALQWACHEMDRRYDVLARAGVRNIAGFNQKLARGELAQLEALDEKDKQKRMPFIVIVVDEFADMIMQAKKEFEDPVIRLAQKARAAGMHMVLATQRPSTNVITGIIKANLPTRISFKVASHIDARTVLDRAGAEKLIGRGDMLFRSIDDSEPTRVHGAFLTDEEAEKVALSCSSQKVQYPQLESFTLAGPEGKDAVDPLESPGAGDDLFWDAAELCVHEGGGSTSMLQRRFSIGYARAGRLMDQLYQAGIVGPERGSKPRETLMSEDELGNLRRTRGV